MWFIGVEVEQETSAPPPKKNPGSAPVVHHIPALDHHVQLVITQRPECGTKKTYLFILSHEFVC